MRRARACASDRRNTERETINRLFSTKISIVLKYMLLKVKLRFKGQYAVRVFYESRNCKGITACNCLNIKIRRFIAAFLQDKEMTVRPDCDQSERVFLQNIPLTCWLTLSLCFYSSLLSLLLL